MLNCWCNQQSNSQNVYHQRTWQYSMWFSYSRSVNWSKTGAKIKLILCLEFTVSFSIRALTVHRAVSIAGRVKALEELRILSGRSTANCSVTQAINASQTSMEQNTKFCGQEDHHIQIPETTCDIEFMFHSWKAADSVLYRLSRCLNFTTNCSSTSHSAQQTYQVLGDFLTTIIVRDHSVQTHLSPVIIQMLWTYRHCNHPGPVITQVLWPYWSLDDTGPVIILVPWW